MTSIRATISIPEDLAKNVERLCLKNDRSFSNQIVVLIRTALVYKQELDPKENADGET